MMQNFDLPQLSKASLSKSFTDSSKDCASRVSYSALGARRNLYDFRSSLMLGNWNSGMHERKKKDYDILRSR